MGGVNGRKINLISLDDGYSPHKTVEQTRRLVEQEQVAFIFGSLGTPTNVAIRQYLNDNKVPQWSLFRARNGTAALARTPVLSGRRPVVKGRFEDTVNVSGAVMSSAF